MYKSKILRAVAIVLIVGLLTGGGIVYYMFNMPHRDVQSSETDYKMTVVELVNEYLTDVEAANQKYLKDDGQSAILEISGIINNISENMNGDITLLLGSSESPVGVKCTLITTLDTRQQSVQKGNEVAVKGVIRAGTYYDEDLQRFEPVIMDQCAIVG